MQVQVVILPTGEIGIFTQEGTFASGQQVIERILRDLHADGLAVETVGEVEQHRHEDQPAVETTARHEQT